MQDFGYTVFSLALSVCRHSGSRTSSPNWRWKACSLALCVCRRHPDSRSSQDWSCSVWTTCSLVMSVCRHPGSTASQPARTGHAQCGRPAVNSVQPAVGQHRCQNLLSHSGLQLRQSVWHHLPEHPSASHRVQRLLQWKWGEHRWLSSLYFFGSLLSRFAECEGVLLQ